MNRRAVFRVVGFILVTVGVAMLMPIGVAVFFHSSDLVSLLISALIPMVLGLVILLGTRGRADLRVRDGFAIVTFGWLAAGIFGSLPYYLSGACPHWIDALFESVSGFTTTGSTIFTDIEALPPGLILWRSLTQWMGGMGIVVLSVAVLPLLGVGGMALFRAEVPGPTTDRLSPRIQSVAKTLWGVYLGLTVSQLLLLKLGGMSWFDSLNHAFCTVSTGGFSPRNASIGAYDSWFIESVVIFFMLLAGANFSLHLWPLRAKMPTYWKNEEFRLYALVVLFATLLIFLSLVFKTNLQANDALRGALFQTVSIITTTGFGTQDYLLWGFGAQILLFCLMFTGACAGSTSGGMKLMRVIVLFKHGVTMAYREIHPRAIYKIRFNNTVVEESVMLRILGFFLLWIFIFFAVALALGLLGMNLNSAMGASIATLGNIGPGFGKVGPTSTFTDIPSLGKVLLSLNMILGRLELYTVLVVFTPVFWRKT